MRKNAIVRIILYTLVAMLLLGILLAGIGIGSYVFHIGTGSDVVVHGSASVDAADVRELKIDWVSGHVTVKSGDTDTILLEESGNFDDNEAMSYSVKNGVLDLSAYSSRVQIGFVSLPSKDLTITVPRDWVCKELELDGASVTVNIEGLSVGTLDIDGASCEINLNGSVEKVECDGASAEINLNCTNRLQRVDLDGAACELQLTLPADCGFSVQMDGLSCDFNSDLDYTGNNGTYRYGDEYCRINADGLSCEITISQSESP